MSESTPNKVQIIPSAGKMSSLIEQFNNAMLIYYSQRSAFSIAKSIHHKIAPTHTSLTAVTKL